jgi:tetratricopeptide (TPR) repeat protein
VQLKERPVTNRTQLAAVLLFAIVLPGCHVSAPENGSDAINLMVRYNEQGRHDDAIKVAQDWLKKHPEDPSHGATFYEQIAITYLLKASKDSAHKDEWIQQAVAYYDKDLLVHQKNEVDLELYTVGRGFESAGDLSTSNSCLYYGRAVKAFEEERPFIQGDNFTAYGHTTSLAPVRQENEKALERVGAKFAKAGCKQEP